MANHVRNIAGQRFGRLVAIEPNGQRDGKGSYIWLLKCDCGKNTIGSLSNLSTGAKKSCGCLALETSAKLGKSKKLPARPICSVVDCCKTAREFNRTLCGMHGKRKRIHGDVNYITPEDVRAERQRTALLSSLSPAKPSTYKKLFGMHEHRRVGMIIAGRALEKHEHVHHVDGNKHNNHQSNLEVLSAQDHASLHARQKNA